ncbi:antirestriction protein [Paraburkholderia sediminicola]|uniref:antirestriction protein n=1 Tax=Paraburkholderia sediminicola TaxID=458836 RepID=UPI0038BC6D4F
MTAINKTTLPEVERLTFLPRMFGTEKMLRAEMLLYYYARKLAWQDYQGGLWDFHLLSNGSGYASPVTDQPLKLSVEGNGFDGEMSADAAGIVISLFVFNHLAFECSGKDEPLSAKMIEHWEHLRDYAQQHTEARRIYRAID